MPTRVSKGRLGVAAVLVLAIGAGVATATLAATRQCLEPIIAFGVDAKLENEARRKALAAWTADARKNGEVFAQWRLAWQKSIECNRLPSGGFQCKAIGRPCGITQIPGQTPPGARPVVRPQPGAA